MAARWKPDQKAPTELEGCVLGVVRVKGPCTPYAIRRVFVDSPSPWWSGSAGAIYPLVRRLEAAGLIRSERLATGRRKGKLCRLTRPGAAALRAWLGPPMPDWVVGVPMDPLRTRLEFIRALPPARRRAFLEEAEAGVRLHLAKVRGDLRAQKAAGDRLAWLASRGANRMMRARLAWIREARAVLGRRALSAPSG